MAPKRSLFRDNPPSPLPHSDSSSDDDEDVEELVNQAVQSVIQSTSSLKPPIQKIPINSIQQSDSDEESESESDKEQETLIETTPSVKSPIEKILTNSTQQLESEEESESDEEQETLIKPTPSEKAPIPKNPSKSKQAEEEESDESETPIETTQKFSTPEQSETSIETTQKLSTPEQSETSIETTQKLSTPEPDSGTKSSSKLPKSNGNVAKGNGKEETLIEVEKKGRVWSFKDEIAVLQGVIDFKKSKHSDSGSKPDEFYNFIKKKLMNSKYRKTQVLDKVRRMKNKFMNRSIVGKNPEFSNLHERKCFQLSTVIWGSNSDVKFCTKANGSVGRSVKITRSNSDAKFNSNANGGGSRSVKRIKVSLNDMEVDDDDEEEEEMGGNVGGKVELNGGEVGVVEDYSYLMKSFEDRGFPRLSVVEDLKSGLGFVDSSALDEWESKWEAIREAELDIYARRLALVQEQTSVLMQVMKSSKS